jgi:hypothetical protein
MRPGDQLPLFISTRTLLVRSPDTLEQTEPQPFQPPLRILAIVSRPQGTAPLNLDEERARISAIWGPIPGVKVEIVAPVVAEILKVLSAGDYHVIHYMGHGDIDPSTGKGVLLMEDKTGGPHRVSGEDLAVYLKDELGALRLVFLNACKTAQTGAAGGFDPFSGVATALIQSGVPAVLAMQFPVTDAAAITFSEIFYQSVAQGMPIDTAVAEGRKALWGGAQSEWATPVLFLRSSDGQLFTPATGTISSQAAAATPPAPADTASAAPSTTGSRPAAASRPEDEAWGAGSGSRVFMAAADQAVGNICRQLAGALRKEGARVVDAIPPPYDDPDHAARVRALAAEADLCVHVLGDSPGAEMDGEPPAGLAPLRTYPLEQLRIALEAARSQLVLIPEHVDVAALEDARYAERIRELGRMPRDDRRFQLVWTGRQQMKDAVLTRLKEIETARRVASSTESAVRTAFVDLHYADLAHATDLIAYLGRRNITPIMMPTTDQSPADALSMFEANVANVPLYLVVFGGVTRDWVTNRLREAFQSVLKHPGARTRIGVYVAPPVKGTDQLAFPPFCDVAANMSTFDASSIDALIAKATA